MSRMVHTASWRQIGPWRAGVSVGLAILALLCAGAKVSAQEVDASKIYLTTCLLLPGSGSPEGAVSAPVCSTYWRTDTGDMYRKTSGTGNTGWTVVGSGFTPAPLTKADDTNVTLTLGGTPATALLQAASLTAGWTGTLAVARGGTGAGTLTGYVYGAGTGAMTAATTVPAASMAAGTFGAGTWDFTGTVAATGGVAGSLVPAATDTYNLGSYSKLWSQGYLSKLNAILFALNTQTVFAGYSTVGYGAGTFGADVAAGESTINFGVSMTAYIGDWIVVRSTTSAGVVTSEHLLIGTLVSGTTYNVTRDLGLINAPDPAWPKGTPYLILGHAGTGRLDLLAYDGKPRISMIAQGATYGAGTEYVRLGDLEGFLGIAAGKVGIALGDATASLTYFDGVLAVKGAITADTGYIGGTSGWIISAGYIKDTAGATGMSSVVSGGDDIRFWAGHATPASAPFRVTEAGALTASTVNISAGGVTLDTTGLYISPVSASGGGAYANANAVRWTTDTTYRTAIWRSDDSSASAWKKWNFEHFEAGANTVEAATYQRTRGYIAGATTQYGEAMTWANSQSTGSLAQYVAQAQVYTGSTIDTALLVLEGDAGSTVTRATLGVGTYSYTSSSFVVALSKGLVVRATGGNSSFTGALDITGAITGSSTVDATGYKVGAAVGVSKNCNGTQPMTMTGGIVTTCTSADPEALTVDQRVQLLERQVAVLTAMLAGQKQ